VIGGENFVPGATEPSATSSLNNPHGTWVASTMGGNRAFGVLRASATAVAIRNNCPQPNCSFQASPTVDAIPIVGQAPAVQFYALKVFPAAGGGAPEAAFCRRWTGPFSPSDVAGDEGREHELRWNGALRSRHRDELATAMAAAG
jgi:hypothetical protein